MDLYGDPDFARVPFSRGTPAPDRAVVGVGTTDPHEHCGQAALVSLMLGALSGAAAVVLGYLVYRVLT